MTRAPAAADRATQLRVGGDLATRPDGAVSAQGMDVGQIARVTFASPDRVRDVLHNFNLDGFDALYPRYRGGRPPTFTLAQRRAIKQLALSRPVDHDLPFSTWSLAKLASSWSPRGGRRHQP